LKASPYQREKKEKNPFNLTSSFQEEVIINYCSAE